MIVGEGLLKRFWKGRRRTYRIALGHILFILVKTLKGDVSWQFCSTKFRTPLSIFQRLLWHVMKTVVDHLHDYVAVAVSKKYG